MLFSVLNYCFRHKVVLHAKQSYKYVYLFEVEINMKNWITTIETAVLGMVILRIISGLIEITAASIMLKFNSIDKALMVNAALAIVGPIILISTMSIGLIGIADKLSYSKLLLIGLGVLLILIGIRR